MVEKNSAFHNIHNCTEAGIVGPQSRQYIQPWKSTGKTKDAITEESERAARKLEECLNESNGYYSSVYSMDASSAANAVVSSTEINTNEQNLEDTGCTSKEATAAYDANGAKL